MKVGIRDATGDVGWINLQQWRAARQALLKPQITTVYVNQTFPKDGQPVVNMVVYRDGEPLSEEEARQLHQAMRQHHRTWQRFSRIDDMDAASWHHQVDDIMRWMMRPHQRAWWRYDDFWSW